MNTVLEILKYILPAIVVLIACYTIVQKFLVTDMQRKQIAMLRENQEFTVRMRLQALERLALYIERINPRSLIPRVYMSGMTVTDLQQALVFTIRGEFEHNLSQQIYVSSNVWNTVKGVMEQEINMIGVIAQQLKPDAPAKELHMRIVDVVLTDASEPPTTVALQIINEEAKRILSIGAMG